jgi:D-sedoheptulose 7-phosphate isomerase
LTDLAASLRRDFVRDYLNDVRRCLDALPAADVARFLECLERAYRDDRQVYLIGNGGSAATASHMACDLAKNVYPPASTGRVRRFRVTSLTDNVALITALANDCGYDRVFSEQLNNLLQRDDLLIAVSASGNSPNVLDAIALARERGARTAALLGFGGGRARDMVDVALVVASDDYGHVEDLHLVLNHLVAAWMRQLLHAAVDSSAPRSPLWTLS